MFTPEECRQHLSQIAFLERRVIYSLSESLERLSEGGTRSKIETLRQDEIQYYTEMQEILDNLWQLGRKEKRGRERKDLLAIVRLKEKGCDREIKAYGVDVSEKGLGIESEDAIEAGKDYEIDVEVLPSGKLKVKGRMMWVRKVKLGLFAGYLGGIRLQ